MAEVQIGGQVRLRVLRRVDDSLFIFFYAILNEG